MLVGALSGLVMILGAACLSLAVVATEALPHNPFDDLDPVLAFLCCYAAGVSLGLLLFMALWGAFA